jgi:hypothetical protein
MAKYQLKLWGELNVLLEEFNYFVRAGFFKLIVFMDPL